MRSLPYAVRAASQFLTKPSEIWWTLIRLIRKVVVLWSQFGHDTDAESIRHGPYMFDVQRFKIIVSEGRSDLNQELLDLIRLSATVLLTVAEASPLADSLTCGRI